jgi:hypothetical protein
MKRALGLLLAIAGTAHAEDLDPCANSLVEPVPTPLRDVAIDAQRAACARDELSTYAQADILVDTPGFHGELGGDLRVGARMQLRALELFAGVRLTRFVFAQNAVNKVTALQFGPLTLGAAYVGRVGDGANAALTAVLEVPYTRDDTATMHASGSVNALLTGALARRTFVHARLGMVAMHASSTGGSTTRTAARAGLDLVQLLGARFAVGAGIESQAGWYAGLDHVALRLSLQWRMFDVWRGAIGAGLPVAGEERTNAIITLGLVRDLR